MRLRGHMREPALVHMVNIEEKAAGVWVSGDLELKGVLGFSLGESHHFITSLINYVLLIYPNTIG